MVAGAAAGSEKQRRVGLAGVPPRGRGEERRERPAAAVSMPRGTLRRPVRPLPGRAQPGTGNLHRSQACAATCAPRRPRTSWRLPCRGHFSRASAPGKNVSGRVDTRRDTATTGTLASPGQWQRAGPLALCRAGGQVRHPPPPPPRRAGAASHRASHAAALNAAHTRRGVARSILDILVRQPLSRSTCTGDCRTSQRGKTETTMACSNLLLLLQ